MVRLLCCKVNALSQIPCPVKKKGSKPRWQAEILNTPYSFGLLWFSNNRTNTEGLKIIEDYVLPLKFDCK